jgi:hypothetical protein
MGGPYGIMMMIVGVAQWVARAEWIIDSIYRYPIAWDYCEYIFGFGIIRHYRG